MSRSEVLDNLHTAQWRLLYKKIYGALSVSVNCVEHGTRTAWLNVLIVEAESRIKRCDWNMLLNSQRYLIFLYNGRTCQEHPHHVCSFLTSWLLLVLSALVIVP